MTGITLVDKRYRNKKNVRRFLTEQCGVDFWFESDFMAWVRNEVPKTLADVADEWKRRQSP
ncbi:MULTISPECIES: DUF6434 domain-containing protein [Buttiauxella]|uniref:DUF6434 domain-containing protein n=1 Tax=Buttiauxella TaxID=82976 RepID=UPI0024447C54|nr:DUF6434 domain-containing protein [Buttiauxella sp. BIGb0552]